MLYCLLQHHNDTINKQTQEDFFNKICTSHLIARVQKRYSRFACERELETEQKLQYFDPHSYGRQRCLSRSPWLLNRRPRSPLCWVICYILSATSLHPNSIGGPEPLQPGVAFLTTSRLSLRPISNCNSDFCLD